LIIHLVNGGPLPARTAKRIDQVVLDIRFCASFSDALARRVSWHMYAEGLTVAGDGETAAYWVFP